VLQTILRPQLATVLLLLFLAVAYVGFRSLRYSEFGILGQYLFAGEFRRTLRTMIDLQEYEESLAQAGTIEQCWQALSNTCRETNFTEVSLRVDGKHFGVEFQPGSTTARRLHIAFSRSDGATFGHEASVPGPAMLIAPLAERLQEKLGQLEMTTAWLASDAPTPDREQVKGAVAR
jgi:hypothetical protein